MINNICNTYMNIIKKQNKLHNKRILQLNSLNINGDAYLILSYDMAEDSIHISNHLYPYKLMIFKINDLPKNIHFEYHSTDIDCERAFDKHFKNLKNKLFTEYKSENKDIYHVRIMNEKNGDLTYFVTDEENLLSFNPIKNNEFHWYNTREK